VRRRWGGCRTLWVGPTRHAPRDQLTRASGPTRHASGAKLIGAGAAAIRSFLDEADAYRPQGLLGSSSSLEGSVIHEGWVSTKAVATDSAVAASPRS
jgi:hypothetical protein